MPFRKGKTRPPSSGRRKGTPNAITRDLREIVRAALEGVGGQAYLQRQAEENPTAFLTLVGKCLPKDVSIDGPTLMTVRWAGEMPKRGA